MQLREDLRDLRDVFGEMSLIHLIGDVSEICKLALFEMSPRHCMRRLRDASEMHPCRLGIRVHLTMQHTLIALKLNIFQKNLKIHRKQNRILYNSINSIYNSL